MQLTFSTHAWEDYLYWQQADKAILKRINALIAEIQRTLFEGRGKPERNACDMACPAIGLDALLMSIGWSIRC